ncbi:hypothetical protein ACF0H5_008064 [Mactra antiquata]
MALVLGHSQTKYLSEYFNSESYSVFSYPGSKTRDLLRDDFMYDVLPFFSAVVLVSGTNDVGRMVPECIVKDLFDLCDEIKQCSPSATVFISEILPRSQNQFIGCNLRPEYLVKWNRDATTVNTLLNQRVQSVLWIRLIRHPEFHTTTGPRRSLLSRDGLHLSFQGTSTLVQNINREFNYVIAHQRQETSRPQGCSTVQKEKTFIGPLKYSEVLMMNLSAKDSDSVNIQNNCVNIIKTKDVKKISGNDGLSVTCNKNCDKKSDTNTIVQGSTM